MQNQTKRARKKLYKYLLETRPELEGLENCVVLPETNINEYGEGQIAWTFCDENQKTVAKLRVEIEATITLKAKSLQLERREYKDLDVGSVVVNGEVEDNESDESNQ